MSEEMKKLLNQGGKLSIEAIDDENYKETIEGTNIMIQFLLSVLVSDIISKSKISKKDIEEAVEIGIEDGEEKLRSKTYKVIDARGMPKEEALKLISDLMN